MVEAACAAAAIMTHRLSGRMMVQEPDLPGKRLTANPVERLRMGWNVLEGIARTAMGGIGHAGFVHRYGEIEWYAETIRQPLTPFHLVYGGDSYLNDQTVRDLKHEAQRRYPDAETIEPDAANADHYAFDVAVSPSLLADRAIVIVTNLQNADEKLGDAMVSYCRQACKEPADACIVICQHEGGV